MSSPSSRILDQCLSVPKALLSNPKYFWYLAALVVIADALLTGFIIQFVPYTEIDWETYMVQTKVFLQGQHNYSMITGPTGPLVYPAGHVRIHQFLYDITDAGNDIMLAQRIYGALYLCTLVFSCAIYRRAGTIPNWILLLLPLSKRLHSIFALRLFNDLLNGFYDTGIMLFSAALSVKMSILLYLPGLLVILFKRRGLFLTLVHLVTLSATQVLFAAPFLREDPWGYARSAFDLGRVFLYKWTVNWRILDEETFLSNRLATTLLVGHGTALIAFGLFKWCAPDGGVASVLYRGLQRPLHPAGLVPVTADYVATVLFTSNLVGIIFARSLHYQFYSWYAQQIPFLAWRTRYPWPLRLALILGIEYAWNIFPSTPISSGILLTCNVLLLAGIWFGYPTGKR
ncbi:glycosyltransferase family 58 protein [Hebeloma cylindrosporum]|uniref:Dol-P-Man:Man(5)GlcNAc(2)-PP-Dol alpha-1,3-mannosyltransferase n=1 Tax=Hebeloma cylindrosporum TaxID=76867 RepID=A0A0C2YI88_HEBCY|nr:glycosyltransferase family 58 protein [Hebeloma cylindrosporum h7]